VPPEVCGVFERRGRDAADKPKHGAVGQRHRWQRSYPAYLDIQLLTSTVRLLSRRALLGAGLSPLVADVLVGLDQMFRESVIAETTSTVEDLTGRARVR
jgi:ABC-type thiamine transport system substrate-binding protein